MKCGTQVTIAVEIGKGKCIVHTFIVIDSCDLDFCFLFGIDLMRANDISIDFAQARIGIHGDYNLGLLLGDTLGINSSSFIQLCPITNERLNDCDFRRMQKGCDCLQALHYALRAALPVDRSMVRRDCRIQTLC